MINMQMDQFFSKNFLTWVLHLIINKKLFLCTLLNRVEGTMLPGGICGSTHTAIYKNGCDSGCSPTPGRRPGGACGTPVA